MPRRGPPPLIRARTIRYLLDTRGRSRNPRVGFLQSGASVVVHMRPDTLFRAECAEAIEGIDYDLFALEAAWVGFRPMFRSARPAREFLEQLRWPSDGPLDGDLTFNSSNSEMFSICDAATAISVRVRNVSDRPARFAVWLAGKAVF